MKVISYSKLSLIFLALAIIVLYSWLYPFIVTFAIKSKTLAILSDQLFGFLYRINPLIYTVLSFIPPPAAIFTAIVSIKRKERNKKLSYVVIFLGMFLLIVEILVVSLAAAAVYML